MEKADADFSLFVLVGLTIKMSKQTWVRETLKEFVWVTASFFFSRIELEFEGNPHLEECWSKKQTKAYQNEDKNKENNERAGPLREREKY